MPLNLPTLYMDGESFSVNVVGWKWLVPSSLIVSDQENQADRWLGLGGHSSFFHSVSHKLCTSCYRRKHRTRSSGKGMDSSWPEKNREDQQLTTIYHSGLLWKLKAEFQNNYVWQTLLVKVKLISHWAFSFFLFSILWSFRNDVSINLFLYLNDSFLK